MEQHDQIDQLKEKLTDDEFKTAVDFAQGHSKESLMEAIADEPSALKAEDYDKLAEDIYHGRYASIDRQLDDFARKEIESRIFKKLLKADRERKDARRNQRKTKKANKRKSQKR